MLTPGTRIGSYEVIAQIGAGGMGEVYRATDSNLGRHVAIKVLPEAVASDPERLARFDREAKTLAALNHQNIAVVYGLERSGGTTALVMELVEGPTLADLISHGAIPMDEAMPIARQMAEALEAAHDQGVVHRDLKPANIKVKPDGVVKVLDFGLAKAIEPAGATTAAMSQLPTITTPAMTHVGMILGTAAYMSPEQARGKPVDRRTDIWAFGCVLYEMLTGRRAFEGEDVGAVLARVIEREPDFTALPAATPAPVRRLLRRCLTKDRKRRLADIVDGLLEIDEARSGSAAESTAIADSSHVEELGRANARAARSARGQRAALLTAVLLAIAALALALPYVRQRLEQRPVVKLTVLPPAGVTLAASSVPSISPDGRRLVFAAIQDGRVMLWLRSLGSLDTRPLPGTEGAALPFWSPDGESIGFFADGKVKRVDAAGGSVVMVCDAGGPGRGGTWNRDGVIVFSANLLTPLYRVSSSGGTPVPITKVSPEEPAHRYPWFLPDGRHYLYTAYGRIRDQHRLFVGELDSPDRRAIIPVTSNVIYADGHLLFVRDQNLMAQPFDLATLETTGDAVSIAEGISYTYVDIRGAFSAATDGGLAFTTIGESDARRLTWLDRSGKQVGVIETPGLNPATPAISPDGKFVAFRSSSALGNVDVWIHEVARNVNSKLTFSARTSFFPVWAPDQRWVAYYGTEGGEGSVYRRSPDGGGVEEDMKHPDVYPTDWSKDGRYILFQTLPRPGEGSNLGALPLFGDRTAFTYLATTASERAAKLSPNGKWLLYVSNQSKRNEVYVQSFPAPGGGRWQISTSGGAHPLWSRDGKEIFFASLNGALASVPLESGVGFSPGQARELFPISVDLDNTNGNGFDVAPDGRFLVPVRLERGIEATPVTVVLNWQSDLKK